MKNLTKISALILCFFCINNNLFSQKVGFVDTDQIRKLLPDAQAADQRLKTIQDEWTRELKEIDLLIEAKLFEIQKNRLIWTENEKIQNNNELNELKSQKMDFAKQKYSYGGENDKISEAIQRPVEEKIYGAIQKVAAQNNFDMIWDKSIQPLTYTNFKYDITVKVLKELGVDVGELEAELNKKIASDPRNSPENQSKDTPVRRTRQRRTEVQRNEASEPSQDNTPTSNPSNEREIKREISPIENK